jgi:hypothetical protein
MVAIFNSREAIAACQIVIFIRFQPDLPKRLGQITTNT